MEDSKVNCADAFHQINQDDLFDETNRNFERKHIYKNYRSSFYASKRILTGLLLFYLFQYE